MINKLLVIKSLSRWLRLLAQLRIRIVKVNSYFFISSKFIINIFNRFINDIYDLTRMILILKNRELLSQSDGGTYFYLRCAVPRLCPKYIRISIDFKNQSDIKNFLAGINIFSKNHCSNCYSIMASRDRREPSHQAFSMGKSCLKIHRDTRTGRIANFPSGRPVGNVPVDL